MMAQKRVEKENKEISECSFKPKINGDYSFSQNQTQDYMNVKNERFDRLYKLGTNLNLNRKDRNYEEVEIEKNAKECTFKPTLIPTEVNFESNSRQFEGTSYQKHFDRLKKGRIERKIKDIVNSREPFQPIEELEKKLVNRKKIKNQENTSQNIESQSPQKSVKKNSDKKESKTIESQNTDKNTHFEPEAVDKKEHIPLLIIDVNLRPGEKKKIYVMDGDTAEGLADKFSKDHNLDQDTKNKLKILIQSHMSKLLLKIEEEKENQSINSDISLSNQL